MINLKCYELAVELYRESKALKLPSHLQDQMLRATSSVVLNLAEGYGKRTMKDRTRFFFIALGSIRELQAISDMERELYGMKLKAKLDHLAASVYKLTH